MRDWPAHCDPKLTVAFRLKGFNQIYQLQTENDEEETWRDLVRRIGGPALSILNILTSQPMVLTDR